MSFTPSQLAYGYLRVLPVVGIKDILRLQRDLMAYSQQRELVLADIFIEVRWQQLRAWEEVLLHCRTKGVTNVVMPSSAHLHSIPILAQIMKIEIEAEIRGKLWLAEPPNELAARRTRTVGNA